MTNCAPERASAAGVFIFRPHRNQESIAMSSRRPAGPVTRALIAALEETVPGSDMRNIERIVEQLVGKALEGELAAIREIFDRVDGKSPSGVAGTSEEEPQKVIFQWQSE
jgi:hypothetical protein